MNDNLVYITIDDWVYYGEKENEFVNKLSNNEVDVNCNIVLYDMALFYFITTTKSYIKEHNLEFLESFYADKKHEFHPEYDLSKIGTEENYCFLDDY